MQYSLPKPYVDLDVGVCYQMTLSNSQSSPVEPNDSDLHSMCNQNGRKESSGKTKGDTLVHLKKWSKSEYEECNKICNNQLE